MKRVLLLNGSPRERGNTYEALALAEAELKDRGIKTEWFNIGGDPVRGCIACGKCRSTSRCVFDDDCCNALTEAFLRNDGIIIGSPVYFAGINGSLSALLDRVFYSASTHGRLMEGKAAAAIVSCYRGGATSALDRLNKYFSYSAMPIVGSTYWNLVFRPGARGETDSFGHQVIKELGRNMADMLEKL